MTRTALRLLGHMASRSKNILIGVQKRNLFDVTLQTGVNLIEMTGSIITYNETVKQTAYLEQTIELEKEIIRKTYAKKREAMDDEIAQQNEKILLKLQKVTQHLNHELESYKQQFETVLMKHEQTAEEQLQQKEMVRKMLESYNISLQLCKQAIQQTIADTKKQEAFNENYRLINKDVCKLIEESI